MNDAKPTCGWNEAKPYRQPESEPPVRSTDWLGDVGKPNYTPMRGNVAWEHPRMEAACSELMAAAENLAAERKKWPRETSFDEWAKQCSRLENAAIAFTNTLREYTIT